MSDDPQRESGPSSSSPVPRSGSDEELPLLETLDHLLDRGVVIAGEAVISSG